MNLAGAAVFDWLLENRTTLLILFAAAAVILGMAWWRTRRRQYLYGLGGVAALAGVYSLVTLLAPETDPQQLERKLHEMVAGVNERQLDRSFAHVSESFNRRGRNKRDFRQAAESALRAFDVRNVRVWDIEIVEVSRGQRTAQVSFHVKADGNWPARDAFFRCEMDFVLDPDGEWRMQGFELFKPVLESSQPAEVPF